MTRNIIDLVQDKLDHRVMTTVVFLTVVEFELFTVARIVVKYAGRDAWISLILGQLALFFNIYLLILLATRFPKENFFQYVDKVWGKVLGFLIKLFFIVFWVSMITIMFKDISLVNKIIFLPRTPAIIPLLFLGFAGVWLVAYGFAALVKFLQLQVPFLVVPLLVLIVLGLPNISLEKLTPVLSQGMLPVLKGTFFVVGSIQGLEVILFAAPFIKNPSKILIPSLLGVSAPFFFNILLTLISLGTYGAANITYAIFPGYSASSMIRLPGFPVERYELFLTLPWIVGVFTTICVFLYLLSYTTKQMIKFDNRKLVFAIIAFLTVIATYLIPNQAWAVLYREWVVYYSLIVSFVIPALTLLLAIVRGKGGAS